MWLRCLSSPMRAPTLSLPLLLVALPLATLAQERPGMDLSKPKAAPAATSPSEKSPTVTGAADPSALEKAVGVPGESDAALEDRVKAVQRKGFLKRNRFQLSIFAAPTLNDAFFQKVGVGGQLAYNIHDSFAVALRGAYWFSFKTQYVKIGAYAFQSQLLQSQLYWTGMADLIWTPVYGKFSWLGKSIVHFDAFVLAGGGVAWTATSTAPRNEGPHLAADLGAGIRFYPNDWLSLDLALVGTFYADQKAATLPASIQKVVALTVGVSFFLPTRFEYEHP